MKFNWDSNKYTKISDLQEKVGNELIEKLNLKEDYRVLDAGCGIGNITFKVAEIVKNGHVLGIDSSSSMIKKGNNKVKFKKGISELGFPMVCAVFG